MARKQSKLLHFLLLNFHSIQTSPKVNSLRDISKQIVMYVLAAAPNIQHQCFLSWCLTSILPSTWLQFHCT